jgi:hypothetical protein
METKPLVPGINTSEESYTICMDFRTTDIGSGQCQHMFPKSAARVITTKVA